jgi:hypothetical protein
MRAETPGRPTLRRLASNTKRQRPPLRFVPMELRGERRQRCRLRRLLHASHLSAELRWDDAVHRGGPTTGVNKLRRRRRLRRRLLLGSGEAMRRASQRRLVRPKRRPRAQQRPAVHCLWRPYLRRAVRESVQLPGGLSLIGSAGAAAARVRGSEPGTAGSRLAHVGTAAGRGRRLTARNRTRAFPCRRRSTSKCRPDSRIAAAGTGGSSCTREGGPRSSAPHTERTACC